MNIHFTKRELDIIRKIAEGLSNKEIGDILFISKHTVKANLETIYQRTNCNNRVQLVIWAIKNKVINL